MEKINKLLRLHEGSKSKPYTCTAGKLTIGVGRNIQDLGLSEDEIDYLLTNDITRVIKELGAAFPWFSGLNEARRDAIIDMAFNLGLPRLFGFKKALSLMAEGGYDAAADEFMDSKWAKDVGERAVRVTTMISTGNYPEL
jgi:lysozyme